VLIFKQDYINLNNNTIVSAGLDNNISIFIMIELLKFLDNNISKLKYNLIVNFSAREEIRLNNFDEFNNVVIDEIIVLDSDLSTDSPLLDKKDMGEINIGSGVVITSVFNDTMFEKFYKIAKAKNISYQKYFSKEGAIQSNAYFYSKKNINLQFIGTPLGNIHSSTEYVNKNDVKSTYNLLKAYLTI